MPPFALRSGEPSVVDQTGEALPGYLRGWALPGVGLSNIMIERQLSTVMK
jgi:hypothetical protein